MHSIPSVDCSFCDVVCKEAATERVKQAAQELKRYQQGIVRIDAPPEVLPTIFPHVESAIYKTFSRMYRTIHREGKRDVPEFRVEVEKRMAEPEHFGDALIRFAKRSQELSDREFSSNETKHLHAILQRQKGFTFDHVRGAIGEILLCRLVRNMQHEYGGGMLALLYKSKDSDVMRNRNFLRREKSLSFFSRHNCGFKNRRGKTIAEFDGVALLQNKNVLILDATMSRRSLAKKDTENRLEFARRYFYWPVRFLHVVMGKQYSLEQDQTQSSWTAELAWKKHVEKFAEKQREAQD